MRRFVPACIATLSAAWLLLHPIAESAPVAAPDALVALGRALFFDRDLSRDRTQACATCHDPSRAFTDPRKEAFDGAVSLGDGDRMTGLRNTPTISYAAFSPGFGTDTDGNIAGGQFWDGRADTLEAQAGQPILNPVEMNMPDRQSVVARLKEKPDYVTSFETLFGADVFKRTDTAFAALSSALSAYERSPEVSPFDSKYDRYLRGEYQMTPKEELGRVLFFSNQFTNCHQCHKLTAMGGEGETFTNYRFHNIGVPANPDLKVPVDHGLMAGRKLKDRQSDGRFKVPTLRNVAVTGPYMHNGVFKDLRTTVLFYNKYVSHAPARQLNPETGSRWDPPEIPRTVSLKELQAAPALDDRRIEALVAFLKTLTDRRYEPLLAPER